MYKTIKVDGNDYKLQYSVEAAMYDECTAKVITLMTAIGDEKEDEENLKSKIKEISSIPNLAVSMFYAGTFTAPWNRSRGWNCKKHFRSKKHFSEIYFRK